jgi:hypothetical protein
MTVSGPLTVCVSKLNKWGSLQRTAHLTTVPVPPLSSPVDRPQVSQLQFYLTIYGCPVS